MSKRRDLSGRYATRRSPKFIAGAWVAGFLSVGLLYVISRVFTSDLASFRSCNANNSGLSIVSCGKQSPNFGDVLIFLVFVMAAALTVSLFTAAWRFSRKAD